MQNYDYVNGVLVFKKAWHKSKIGKPVGGPMVSGKRRYLNSTPVARLVWIYHNGPIPKGMVVDHIDEDCGNDRIENLQLLSHKANIAKHYGY